MKGNVIDGATDPANIYTQESGSTCLDMGGAGAEANTFLNYTGNLRLEHTGATMDIVQPSPAALSTENDDVPVLEVYTTPTYGAGSCP